MSNDPNNPCFWDSQDDACKEFGKIDAIDGAAIFTAGQVMRANGTFAVIAAFQVLTQVFQLFRYRT